MIAQGLAELAQVRPTRPRVRRRVGFGRRWESAGNRRDNAGDVAHRFLRPEPAPDRVPTVPGLAYDRPNGAPVPLEALHAGHACPTMAAALGSAVPADEAVIGRGLRAVVGSSAAGEGRSPPP